MSRNTRLTWSLLLLAGCGTAKDKNTGRESVAVTSSRRDQVDILFMIDNSPSMTPKQTLLQQQFPLFIDKLKLFAQAGRPASYHIGVVTSDLGAGPTSLGNAACVPGGQGGKLQSLGAAAGSACLPLADNFIDYNQLTNTDNLPDGQNVEASFSCIAQVGDSGCGYEHQLESIYSALRNPPAENVGFVRDDAVLAVVLLTDEDDCSAPPSTDLFDPRQLQYGLANSFRCTEYGLEYGGQPQFPLSEEQQTLGNIQSAPGALEDTLPGHLWDLHRYTDLFTKSRSGGGLKDVPSDLFVATIDAPVVNDSIEVVRTAPCDQNMNIAECPTLSHSCVLATDSNFFADPAVRINQAVSAAPHHSIQSICEPPYASALDQLSSHIAQQLEGCLPSAVRYADGSASCLVHDVDKSSGLSSLVPECDATRSKLPCWTLLDNTSCTPQHNSITGQDEQLTLTTCREATCDPAQSAAPDTVENDAHCDLLTGHSAL